MVEQVVVHVKEPVLQPRVNLAPRAAHHGVKIVILPKGGSHGVRLLKALAHRVHPRDVLQRLRRVEGAVPAVGRLPVHRGVNIVDGDAVALRVRQRRGNAVAVIGVGQRFRARLAHAERSHRHLRVHIGVVFGGRAVERGQRRVRRPAGKRDGLARLLRAHGEQRQAGICLLAPVILQIHVLAGRIVRGKLVLAVPLAGREVVERAQLVRLCLVKRDLRLEAEIIRRRALHHGAPRDLQRPADHVVAVAHEQHGAVVRLKPRLRAHRAVLRAHVLIGNVAEFVQRPVRLHGDVHRPPVEIQFPPVLLHGQAAVPKQDGIAVHVEFHVQFLPKKFAPEELFLPLAGDHLYSSMAAARRQPSCAGNRPLIHN